MSSAEIEASPAAPLSLKDKPSVTSLESAATVARRLDRSVRTVDRYVEVGILPEPLRIRGRRFWPAGVMPKIDAA